MVIGSCTIELYLPGANSLKGKRKVLRGLLARLHREFNVSAAEVALHDVWKSASIAVVIASTESAHAERTLESVVRWIENNRPDVQVVDHTVELIR